MPEPITFPSTTLNAALPLLLSGQSQKEFFVNQSLAILDALLPMAVEAVQNEPPIDPEDGVCFVVGTAGAGDWSDQSDHIAIRIAGSWHFVGPSEGMAIHDRTTNQSLFYSTQWNRITAPATPSGGAVIDLEARAAIDSLINRLVDAGIMAAPA